MVLTPVKAKGSNGALAEGALRANFGAVAAGTPDRSYLGGGFFFFWSLLLAAGCGCGWGWDACAT